MSYGLIKVRRPFIKLFILLCLYEHFFLIGTAIVKIQQICNNTFKNRYYSIL
jgi:hypothetical protein